MIPEDPARVVQKAQLDGLRALVGILYEKTNKSTKKIYSRARLRLGKSVAKWEKSIEEGNPDFSLVAKKENTFRVDELANIWETTALYGNTERKRVKSERDGLVGPVNRFLNISGALLRDHILFLLPLEEPTEIGKKKTKTIWGYESDTVGKVPVAHGADLPELDLADMIRSHVREFARKAYISSTDFREFSRYAYLLIRRLTPFIECIYTDGKHGRMRFHRPKNEKERLADDGPCADEILRELVNEIASVYGSKRGRLSRLSRSKSKRASTLVKSFFEDQIDELLSDDGQLSQDQILVRWKWVADLRELTKGKKPRLRVRDAEYIRTQASTIARWEGTYSHKIITDGFVQPFNLTDLIAGRTTAQNLDSKFAIATEVPIQTDRGKGKADIVLLQHLERESEKTLLKPIAVFELKTRTGMNWEILPKKVKSKRIDKKTGKQLKKVVGSLRLRKRRLTDREWEAELGCIPTPADSSQLGIYEHGLVSDYKDGV
ncbi:MAG: hypothetical protein P1Q69_20710, partial [Candidatus Thorarchaeota archaeon]|nr:hypothetical protein [Candidatus Thorarchaeota archaeon]